MSLFELDHDAARARPRRTWLLETLIVVGLLAFGAFALLADAPGNALDPLAELTAIAPR